MVAVRAAQKELCCGWAMIGSLEYEVTVAIGGTYTIESVVLLEMMTSPNNTCLAEVLAGVSINPTSFHRLSVSAFISLEC